MEAKQHKIEVNRTAHYYTLGERVTTAKNVWIVFHGYGQLASRIIQKFNHLDSVDNYVIALEGLSKFYWSRNPTTVGASWMTKEHRLNEIDDYLKYFDLVLLPIVNNLKKGQSLHVLGFSQGASTMWRWIANTRPAVSKIINWAGEFPPDVDYKALQAYLSPIPHKLYCVGTEDEFLTSERKSFLEAFIEKHQLEFTIIEFEGKHVMNRELIMEIANKD